MKNPCRPRRVLISAGCVLMLCAVPDRGAAPPRAEELRIPARGARFGSLAVASRGPLLALVWAVPDGKTTRLVAAVSQDGGGTFSTPEEIGTSPYELAHGRASVGVLPRSGPAAARGGEIMAAWPTTHQGRPGIAVAESGDEGRSFSRRFLRAPRLPTTAAVASIAFGPDGRVHVLWVAGNTLLYAPSEGTSLVTPRPLDDAVSGCRVAAMGVGPDGAVSIFWHRAFGRGDEEFAFVRAGGRGEPFGLVARVSSEPWHFRSCPGLSPSLSIDTAGAIRFVFQATLPGTEARAGFFTDASPDGRRFRPRTHLAADGFADVRGPQVVPDGEGGLSLAWDGVRNGRRYVVIRHSPGVPGGGGGLDADWMRPAPPVVLDQSGHGSAPVVAATPHAVVAAWMTRDERGVAVAVRRLSTEELCGLAPGRPAPRSTR